MIPTLDDRFWSKVDKIPGGCWVWKAYVEKSGYGKFNYKGRVERVYRLTYLAFVGPIQKGMVLDHLCRNRACCNPEHLEQVTQAVNCRRGAMGELHTHCPHGHEFTPENTYIANTKKGPRRNCRTCALARQASHYRKNPEPIKQRARLWWKANKDEVNARRREPHLTVHSKPARTA